MRLFVAIEVPEIERRRLVDWCAVQHWLEQDGAGLKWVAEGNLHLTLKFLGEVPDAEVPDVCDALGRVETNGPIPLHIQGLTCLPPRGRIGVVVAGISGDRDRLTTLQMDIDCRLKEIGFPQEGRIFRPHITVARRRGRAHVSGLLRKSVAECEEPLGKPFLVESFVLMSSKLTPTGAIYTPVARFSLTGK